MPPAAVIAGVQAALAAGSCSADVVAVEARKHAATGPGAGSQTAWQALPAPRRSRAAVVTLPHRPAALQAARRPVPSVTAYDQLLTGHQTARHGGA
jgi:dienelactone hydrolase